MKQMILVGVLSLLAMQSFGATVKSAKLDESQKNILIEVTYGGGCAKHDFSLKMGSCLESYPVQCSAQLIDNTVDPCEAIINKTITISLEKAGLTDSYYERASLVITGDKDWETNKES